ncbi:MAG: hypothetical protein ABGY95_04565 [Rubritalea sp.]
MAQDAPAAIIVDDTDLTEYDSDNSLTGKEVETSQSLDALEPSENLDKPEKSEETPESVLVVVEHEPLPRQPKDMRLPEPNEPVTVKIELPEQINLSEAQTGTFQLLTPWAPKPMQKPPIGWRYIPAEQEKAYPIKVKLTTGKTLSLSVTPYTLVPEISSRIIQAREPGYEPRRGYQQVHSISASLRTTTNNLEQAGNSLDQSIANLAALVDSLPK